MARPIEGIPPFKGKAAKWLVEYLETHTKRNPEQVQKDAEMAARIKPLPREDDWDRLVAFFDNLRGHGYTGDSRYPGEKERMMFSADVVRRVVRSFRARARRASASKGWRS